MLVVWYGVKGLQWTSVKRAVCLLLGGGMREGRWGGGGGGGRCLSSQQQTKCIAGADLTRQFCLLLHRDGSCRSNCLI